MNVALLDSFFWDGRAETLEEQVRGPILNPAELGHKDEASAVDAIADDPMYQLLFSAAYGRPPNFEDIGRAIASFERTLIFLDAPFDRFLAGKRGALAPSALAGWKLFEGKAKCIACHPLDAKHPLGTDGQFHNIGISENDPGRFAVTKNPAHAGAFRTAPLRNVFLTAPYMHDGSLATLWDVLDHYNRGGSSQKSQDPRVTRLSLSETEITQIIDFLFALTDDRFKAAASNAYATQRAASQKRKTP
jgi:cytochrome c peroxidase